MLLNYRSFSYDFPPFFQSQQNGWTLTAVTMLHVGIKTCSIGSQTMPTPKQASTSKFHKSKNLKRWTPSDPSLTRHNKTAMLYLSVSKPNGSWSGQASTTATTMVSRSLLRLTFISTVEIGQRSTHWRWWKGQYTMKPCMWIKGQDLLMCVLCRMRVEWFPLYLQ